MKRLVLMLMGVCALNIYAQTDSTSLRIKQLQMEAEKKAQAAARAAEEANRAAQEAADAAAKLKAVTVGKAADTKSSEPSAYTTSKTASSTQGWVAPAPAKKVSNDWDDSYDYDKKSPVYLAQGAVPVVDGKVEWVCNLPNSGKSDSELQSRVDEFFSKLKQEKAVKEVKMLPGKDGSNFYSVIEMLTFSSSFISLDQTQLSYVLEVNVKNGSACLKMSNIVYTYMVNGKPERYRAEDWIVDKQAVNKKHTRLLPISGKFRRKTIDRKNELFQDFKDIIM